MPSPNCGINASSKLTGALPNYRLLMGQSYSGGTTSASSASPKTVARSPPVEDRQEVVHARMPAAEKRSMSCRTIYIRLCRAVAAHKQKWRPGRCEQAIPSSYPPAFLSQRSRIQPKPRLARSTFGSAKSAPPSESGSFSSVLWPIIPSSPQLSQISAPCQAGQAGSTSSLASSVSTGHSLVIMPAVPPPTPNQTGMLLPTTPIKTGSAGLSGKKKAQFDLICYVTDKEEDEAPSPSQSLPLLSLRDQQRNESFGLCLTPTYASKNALQNLAGPSRPRVVAKRNEVEKQEKKEEAERTDSAERGWENPENPEEDAEYSEYDSEDSEDYFAYSERDSEDSEEERMHMEELQRKRERDAYHRRLFAKQRIQLSETEGKWIKPAGLSKLFYPELKHLQHHCPPGSKDEGNVQNQSVRPSLDRPPTGDSSMCAVPSLCSRILSKSLVAMPVLAGQEPPTMVERSRVPHSGSWSRARRTIGSGSEIEPGSGQN